MQSGHLLWVATPWTHAISCDSRGCFLKWESGGVQFTISWNSKLENFGPMGKAWLQRMQGHLSWLSESFSAGEFRLGHFYESTFTACPAWRSGQWKVGDDDRTPWPPVAIGLGVPTVLRTTAGSWRRGCGASTWTTGRVQLAVLKTSGTDRCPWATNGGTLRWFSEQEVRIGQVNHQPSPTQASHEASLSMVKQLYTSISHH